MTKEDYMKLSKERLAELLAERDAIPLVPLQTWQTPCANPNYPCNNPYHDCINCPRIGSGGHYTTTAGISDEEYLQKKIERATPHWEGVDADEFIKHIRGSREYIFADEACKYVDKDPINAFEEGAEYGYKYAVEKACKWLEECCGYVVNGQKCNYENFMKAMEEEK